MGLLVGNSKVCKLRIQYARFCWYPCVKYWLNHKIWVWGYMLGLRPNFYNTRHWPSVPFLTDYTHSVLTSADINLLMKTFQFSGFHTKEPNNNTSLNGKVRNHRSPVPFLTVPILILSSPLPTLICWCKQTTLNQTVELSMVRSNHWPTVPFLTVPILILFSPLPTSTCWWKLLEISTPV